MNTTQIAWTVGETTYHVTATAERIVSVRFSFATVDSDRAKRAFLAGLDADGEEQFFAAVDAALSFPVAA